MAEEYKSDLREVILRDRVELHAPRLEGPDRPPNPSVVPVPVAEIAAPEDPRQTPGDSGAPMG